MTPYWFSKQLPTSRHAIENAVRLAFWGAGFGDTYFTCTQAQPPIKCTGTWRSSHPFSLEWVPMDYFIVRMDRVDNDAFEAFERILGHRATVAYREANGDAVLEWRVQGGEARYAELAQAGVKDLEKLG